MGKPTNINNVETLANIPLILEKTGGGYSATGTENSKGTKIFALAGDVKNTGLVEVPMGISLREIIFDIGEGIPKGRQFKAAQLGGPSGGCVPEEFLDLPIDYESLKQVGAIMGSGGLIVMDDKSCMVDMARYFLEFIQKESCGKCVPCRVGSRHMLDILERICHGKGEEGDIEKLEELADTVKTSSLCALGQTAPNPVLTTLRYFRHEYEEHIHDKHCRAGVCRDLVSYRIDGEKCIGCGVCLKNCPVNAITGEKKAVHFIDSETCISCGKCMDVCKFDAVALV
jgi:NADH:ubiquinone oxidoreductase subunit F (NADH-binding)